MAITGGKGGNYGMSHTVLAHLTPEERDQALKVQMGLNGMWVLLVLFIVCCLLSFVVCCCLLLFVVVCCRLLSFVVCCCLLIK